MERNSVFASVDGVEDGYHIINAANGNMYKVPVGTVGIEHNSYLSVGNVILKLHVPTEPEEDNTENVEPNTEARWSDAATKLLISLYKEYKPLVEERKIKTMKKMWKQIKNDLEQHGHPFAEQQVESKWKSLERSFKNALLHNKKSGRGRKRCAYESELGEILLPRKSIVPPCVMDESKTLSHSEILTQSGFGDVAGPSSANSSIENIDSSLVIEDLPSTTVTPRKIRRRQNQNYEMLFLEAYKTRSELKKASDDRSNDLKERMVIAMERKNTLLETLISTLSNN